ncbi:MAG: ankyrin repeat domain-containing protein [Pirellula sp.]
MLTWILGFVVGGALIGDFQSAISENDLDAVRMYLEEGQDPNEIDDDFRSPLGYAESIEMVDLLVSYGAMIDRPDPQGKTAIWYANEPALLRHLLQKGALPDGGKVNGHTLLEDLCKDYARSSDNLTKERIDLLRENGAVYTARCMISLSDLDSFGKLKAEAWDQNTRDSLFVHAVESDRAIMAYLLLKSGANPNHDPELLFKALKRRELTMLLLDEGADIATEFDMRKFGRSGPRIADRFQAIHRASEDPAYLEGLGVLLERGADPNARDSDGETPLFWAIRTAARDRSNRLLPTIFNLLQSGALNSIESNQGETPITLVQSLKVPDSIRAIVTAKAFRAP